MSIGHYIKTILFSTCIGVVTLLHAEAGTHPFEIKSGMVIYDISGGTQLTPETNLTIKGKAKLRFKEWGEVKLEEESGVVLTTGAIKHKQLVKRLEKQTKDTVITVDYENEQLLERVKSSIDSIVNDETASLVHNGQENVAGILCDVWEGPGVKKCVYKNIVLRLESHVSGVSYIREASKVVFDINTSTAEECEVPDFPVQDFALFKDNIQTKNKYKAQNFCKILKNAAFNVDEHNISDSTVDILNDERKKFINYIARDIYERQKELLPELLKSMQETRACLQTGEDPFTANQCIEHFSHLKSQLGTEEDDYIILWDDKRKNALLDKIEEEIIDLESRMPCVKRAQNITDLSTCMK